MIDEKVVFVVDDDEAAAGSLEALMSSIGMPVATFSSAEEFPPLGGCDASRLFDFGRASRRHGWAGIAKKTQRPGQQSPGDRDQRARRPRAEQQSKRKTARLPVF